MQSNGDHGLEPTKELHADRVELRRLTAEIQAIPGVLVDSETGEVSGARHALQAVLRLSGDPLLPPLGSADAPFELPPFQRHGVGFLHSRRNAILGDDVGVGKTVQAIGAACLLKPTTRKIVLAPAFLRPQWKGEIARWVKTLTGRDPTVKVLLPPSATKKAHRTSGPDDAEWLVGYYHDAPKALALVEGCDYVLIADECHNLRTLGTIRTEAVRTLATFASQTWGLTASLLYNEGVKLHNVLSVIDGSGWGHYVEFGERYTDLTQGAYGLEGGDSMRDDTAEELRVRTAELYLRRTRQNVWKELPFSAKYSTIYLDPPNWAAPGLSGLSQAERLATYKTPAIVEQVKGDLLAGVPSMTVTWLRSHATELAAALPNSLLVLGGQGNRLTSIEAYVEQCQARGLVPHIVATMDSVSEGANLQWVKALNFAALDYMAEKIRQVVGRSVRMGQTGQIPVRFFVAKRTVDEAMIASVLSQLSSQELLDGRAETDKAALAEAFKMSATDVEDAMAEMWRKYASEEG